MLTARGLAVSRGPRHVIHGVDLTARTGRVTGLVGPNGAGKSTLVGALHRALPAATGDVVVDGTDLDRLGRRDIARRIAVVPQENPTAEGLTVRDLVSLGRVPHAGGWERRLGGGRCQADEQAVEAALARAGLAERADRPVDRLSGGERQRAVVARAIAQDASHLLLDEPTSHLDLRGRLEVMELVRSLDATVVVVVHDLDLALAACDEVVVLAGGAVVAAGDPRKVLTPERIRAVWGVRAQRVETTDGPRLVVLGL